MFLYTTISIVIGIILDFIFGDPYWLPHPIRLIGNIISFLDSKLRDNEKSQRSQFINGVLLVFIVVIVSTMVPAIILGFAFKVSIILGVLVESIMCYQLMATKCLKVESMKVYNALKNNNLPEARKAVSMIVGRDTKNLDEVGITKAAVETVAENTSDGSIAPLFYIALGGPILGFFYKSVNTMDSMIGYKNEKYLYFGRCAAKLDDFVNYIPARLSAYFMILSSLVLKYDFKNAIKVYTRDKRKHSSPNAAHTEAVSAGALNIMLCGDAFYFGKIVKKDKIGDEVRPVEIEDIKRVNHLLYCTVILSFLVVIILRLGIYLYGKV